MAVPPGKFFPGSLPYDELLPGFRVGSQRVAENGIKSERLDAGPKNACYYASE
ncbi:hypothetical protein TRIP_B300030 [uncultured Desulfatiglans sp.]|nr:hypothetical protein TRIP_B300030 [uncultured Desulfatiglans sp.]